jgi:hypothetical protein
MVVIMGIDGIRSFHPQSRKSAAAHQQKQR